MGITKVAEDIGLKTAELTRADHLPGIGWWARNRREERVRQANIWARQIRLQPFTGRLAIVGEGTFDGLQPDTDKPTSAEIAELTSRRLHDNLIKSGLARSVVVGSLIPDLHGRDDLVETAADRLTTALRNNYNVSSQLLTEPQLIKSTERYEPITERTYRTIDSVIAGLESRPDEADHKLLVVLVARAIIARDFLLSSLRYDHHLELGGAAVLCEVGVTPGENIWTTNLPLADEQER